jgi:hypothetical protein
MYYPHHPFCLSIVPFVSVSALALTCSACLPLTFGACASCSIVSSSFFSSSSSCTSAFKSPVPTSRACSLGPLSPRMLGSNLLAYSPALYSTQQILLIVDRGLRARRPI